MRVWTTPYLNSLLSITELPVRLISDHAIKRAFLTDAGPEDIAILPLDDTYLEFLHQAKERGIAGPILLISPEPTMLEASLQNFNALVLDLKNMGGAVVNNIVRFILFIARHYYVANAPVCTFEPPQADRQEDKPIEGTKAILQRLAYVQKYEVPVISAIEVRENGEPVTARGTCLIKTIAGDHIVLDRFRQSLLHRSMKPGRTVTLYFAYKQKNHGAIVDVTKATEAEVYVSMPERLFITREMRIQPNPHRPVKLYLLIPNEPTTGLDVFDISTRGIGFLCNRDLSVDQVYACSLLFPDPQVLVQTSAVIRYKKESSRGIRYGAEILPHPWDCESIAKYLMKRETEIISLLRSL